MTKTFIAFIKKKGKLIDNYVSHTLKQHTKTQINKHTNKPSLSHTHIYTYTYTHTYKHTRVQIPKTYTHTHTYTHIHTLIHTYTHTHTHIHKYTHMEHTYHEILIRYFRNDNLRNELIIFKESNTICIS